MGKFGVQSIFILNIIKNAIGFFLKNKKIKTRGMKGKNKNT